jgi:hypothetical protein
VVFTHNVGSTSLQKLAGMAGSGYDSTVQEQDFVEIVVGYWNT